MAYKLTEGALEVIMTGGDVQEPVMQILGSKKIQGTQLHQKLIDGELTDYSIIKVDRFITSVSNNSGKDKKCIIVILALTVLESGTNLGMKIGNLQPWQDGAAQPALLVPAPPVPRAPPNVLMNINGSTKLSTNFVHPIAGINPYKKRWRIKARVISKGQIRTWSNTKGEGKLFSMDLCDESGEIKATAFKDQCDKFFDMIEVDKIYYISRCTVKLANKKYSYLKNNYEIAFTSYTIVKECTDNSGSIPTVQFNFIPISEVATKEPNDIVDVIGICKSSSDIQEIEVRATGKQLKKREITLVDSSGSALSLTLWETEAETFDGSQQPVVAVRAARINEFNGDKSLSLLSTSLLKINPDITDAHKLRGWFDNGGFEQVSVNMSARTGSSEISPSEWITFSDAEERQLGSAEKANYYNVLGVLNYINTDNALYKACPQKACNKKLVDQENDLYRCEKCNREYFNYKYRIIMSGYISDHTGEQWVTIFNETAEAILGRKADEIGQTLETNIKAYTSIFDDVTFKPFIFKIRTKTETNWGKTTLNSTVLAAIPVDLKNANSRLIEEITATTGIQIN